MIPKPTHLGREYAAQFQDASIAAAYSARPPYPRELFEILEELQPSGVRRVLDLGCGTGDVTIGLIKRSQYIDAVDPSAAMLGVARTRPGMNSPRIRWTCAAAEEFDFGGPYSLVVAGESLHWMDWTTVLAKTASSLHPGAYLAVVERGISGRMPWDAELGGLIARFSTNQEFRRYELIDELSSRKLFREVGRRVTSPMEFSQSIDQHIESIHSRNGFSRERMTGVAAREFDESCRRLLARYCGDGVVRLNVVASVVWGVAMP